MNPDVRMLTRYLLVLAGLTLAGTSSAQIPAEVLPSFKADQLFDGSSIERVNIYSGDVQVSVPIGPAYALGSGITWQLTANYSNHLWNVYRSSCGTAVEPCYLPATIDHAVLAGRPTLGAGWSLDVGYITGNVRPDPEGLANGPRYHAPDGSVHTLLNNGGGLWVPDDSLFARFRYESSPAERWSMELPDGSRWWFEHRTEPPTSPNGWDFFDGPYVPVSERKQFGLTRIEDRYDSSRNLLEVHYVSSASWQVDYITLGTRTIDFTWTTFDTTAFDGNGTFTWPVLERIVFPVAASQTLDVTFGREDRALTRSSFENRPTSGCALPSAPYELHAPFLTRISAGDQVYGFTYSSGGVGFTTAALTQVVLPTGGTVDYEYGYDLLAEPCLRGSSSCPSVENYDPGLPPTKPQEEPSCTFSVFQGFLDANPAVERRTESDPVTNVTGYTTYRRASFYESQNPNDSEPNLDKVVRLVVVTRPDGNGVDGRDATKHFFTVETRGGPTGIELERRFYDGTAVGSGTSPLRSVVNCYDTAGITGFVCGVTEAAQGPPWTGSKIPELRIADAQRLRREVTWYGVNPEKGGVCDEETAATIACWTKERDGWDQQAREFEQETTRIPRSGPSLVLMQGNQWGRRTTTNWVPSESPRWLPKLYDSRTVADLYDAGTTPSWPTSVTTSYSFDTSSGKLLSTTVVEGTSSLTRTFGYGPGAGPDPILETLTGAGEIAGTYQTTRTFQNGLVTSSQRTQPAGIAWKQFDVTRDPALGLISKSKDPNALETTYSWDSQARLTRINPPGTEAQESSTIFCYGTWDGDSDPGKGAWALVRKGSATSCESPVATPAAGSETVEAYVYDGFGRLSREIRLLPNTLTTSGSNYLAIRMTERNAAGLVTAVSEWEPCGSGSNPSTCFKSSTTKKTSYSSFDVLGRPRLIVLPDNTQIEKRYDDWDGIFQGNILPSTDTREDIWTSNVTALTSRSYEVSRKDLFGRIVAIAEPTIETDPPSLGAVTFYHYDVHDQVAEVKQERTPAGGSAYTQTRLFSRNALGYLISEAQPESGVTTYGSFTALGLPQEKSNGGLTTKTEYDPLGRVLRVYDTEIDDDTEVNHIVNTYDQNSAAGASQKGKLTTSVGMNTYPSIGYAASFYPGGTITDSFTYAGLGGRLSEKRTSLSNGTVSAVTRWSYNNFGLVLDEAHPRIDPTYPTPFTTTTTYTAGFPTRVAVGTQPVVSSVKYNPAGGLASYTSGNSITTTIAPDPHGMARPSRISTSSGGFDTGLYTYDGAGNILKTGSDTFTYDAASRLLSANLGSSPQNYSYDGWGNLVSKAGTVIPVTKETNRLTNASYDLRGNVEDLGDERYRYDFLGRQVRHDNDVASTHLSYLFDSANERIVRAIPPPLHAPGAPAVLRREMVRIILQMMNQAPSATYADSFDDVPLSDPERGWIEKAYELGLTAGTSTTPPLFSPDLPLTRAQMAVFIASGMTYPGYNIPDFGTARGLPFDCRPDRPTKHSLFGDVPPDHWACRFIHYVYDHEVTSGCTVGTLNYCPDKLIDHWEMQVMVSSAWPGSAYVPPGSTYTFRGLGGQVLTEFEDTVAARSSGYVTQDHVYLGNRLVGTKAGSAWLFHSTDHLGSVRLTTNLSQAVVASRKYWPWGEDTDDPGALAHGFAGMERDIETDSSKPRYYDHARSLEAGYGRFLSPDMLSGNVGDPLSWNRYAYARNNPLKYVDPDGMYVTNCSADDAGCDAYARSFEDTRQDLLGSKDLSVAAAANAYGNPGEENGVIVSFGDPGEGKDGLTTTGELGWSNDRRKAEGPIEVKIRGGLTGVALMNAVGHEGQHVADAQGFLCTVNLWDEPGQWEVSQNLTVEQTETNAFRVTHSILRLARERANGLGFKVPENKVDAAIRKILNGPLYKPNLGRRQYNDFLENP